MFAVTQHIKPEIYPKVEDEATIVVTYPQARELFRLPGTCPSIRGKWKSMGTPATCLFADELVTRSASRHGRKRTQFACRPDIRSERG